MLSHLLINNTFTTPLGIVTCGLNSNNVEVKISDNTNYDNGKSIVYKTLSCTIEVVTFKQRLPLYNGEFVTDCQGWIWRITKDNNIAEKFEINCLLTDYPTNVDLGADPGEYLDAIAANNNEWTLHIGTEDAEIMHARSLNNDWMPLRFADKLGNNSFTSIQLNGMTTNVPELSEGERIHFQYLVAYDKYKRDTVNTWLAVEESKRKLENWIGIW